MPPALVMLANLPKLMPSGTSHRPYSGPVVGRNESCPRGSGATYKKCWDR